MMNRGILTLLAALVAVGALCAGFWRKARIYEAENQQLRAVVSELENTIARKETMDRSSTDQATRAPSQKSELMRLRNEVTQLQGSREAAARAEAALAQLRAERSAPAEAVQPASGTAHDPLIYYRQRRNPELMKRYFPHLFEEQPQDHAPSAPPEASGQPSEADPMAIYRRNPELMKRYFPHLAPEEQPAAPIQNEEAPPQFDPE